VKNKFKFLSLSATGGKAQFRMMLPFGGSTQLALEETMREAILAEIRIAALEPGKETESLGIVSQMSGQPAPIQFNTVEDLLPKETDYYYTDFRAISAAMAPCYGLDFSKPGVLEASVPMLTGQTVYKDHIFWSVDRWVGVVQQSSWDAKGADAGGVPGINARLKIDSKKDPWLVRGLAMEPPAIHSTSVTVPFEFDFSHPDLVEQGRFWSLLGEEVGGEIVRLIVTKILAYWELSLVWNGAQEENKQLPASEASDAGLSANLAQDKDAGGGNPNTQRSETVKLSEQMRKMLGLPDTVGEDVPDAMLLPALTQLGERATVGDALLENARAECLRVATLAEGGAEKQLPEPIAAMIKKATGAELSALTDMYTTRAASLFTQTCSKCGTQMSAAVRSSVEQNTDDPSTPSQQSQGSYDGDSLH
jgi:hypothetical protein